MKCKSCNKKIPEGSNFCNWCGVRQGKLPKAEGDIKIPTPTKLKSGKWHIYLRAEGVSITEASEAKCIAKAKAYRAGYIEEKIKRGDALPLGEAMDKYLADNSNILSPSTLRGYAIIRRNRFQDYMEQDIKTFTDWQAMINEETTLCSPKTLHNAWGFVGAVLRANDITPPRLKEPRQRIQELPWLTYEQIPLFLDAIHGDTCELGALLALSSLRRSELLAVTPAHVANDGSSVLVSGAVVFDENNKLTHKAENKTVKSERTVPVLIPRLQELLKNIDRNEKFIVNWNPSALTTHINVLCERTGLPKVGLHGLRRSFASLGHHLGLSEQEVMLIGGWEDYHTIHKHYLKLAEKDRKRGYEKMAEFYKDAT
jgi:integrase